MHPHCDLKSRLLWSDNRILPEVAGRGVLQDLIPDMGQLEFAQIAIEGWVINPYEHGILDGSGNAMCLPTHNGEIFNTDAMPLDVTMFIDGEGLCGVP